MFYSLIIPVYNRPDEVSELLESLTFQSYKNFEVIVVEDGSDVPCKAIVEQYENTLAVSYFCKENTGPGQTRNYGAAKSKGDYLIFLDSDCIIPPDYLANVQHELQKKNCDFFGGPDRAHDSFTATQKAINYSMTSTFTTGGIRGGKERMDKFYPRSFNMGISREAFETVGGFSQMRFGEDIDLSIRVIGSGYVSRLFPDAWVYHKRRTDLRKFYKQVFNSGMARVNLYKKYPQSLKLVHLFPAFFTLGLFFIVTLPVYLLYFLLIFVDACVKTKEPAVALRAIVSSFVQLFAYGCGFIYAFWKKDKDSAFSKNFYQ